MEYGKLINQAYRIALHNRALWPFGVFAAVGGGGFNFSFDTGGSGGDGGGDSLDIDPAVIAAVVIVVLLVMALSAVATALSQGALAEGVAAIDRGEQRGFRQALRAGRATFWRVVGLYLLFVLIGLGVLLALAVVAGGAVLAAFTVTDAVVLRVLAIVFAVLAALVTVVALLLPLFLIHQHAQREVVLGGARPVAALRGGWRTLRANIGSSIVLLLIQQGLVLAGYVAIGLCAAIGFIPAIVVLVASGAGAAGIVVAAVTALVVVPAALAAAGAVGTFGHGLWTLGYLRMTGGQAVGWPSTTDQGVA
ncbi:MAG TPA: hypothetical protein VFY44_00445 [Thermoleophilaceae bacterium]|nr:hypothetical protein [Thermoleophilaceae bacterium]